MKAEFWLLWILAAATWVGVPAYAAIVRGRLYAVFSAVILTFALPSALILHSRLRELASPDVAIALDDMRHREDWPARRGAFVEGYERVAPLDPIILESLDGLLAARTTDWLLWAGSRAVDNPIFAKNLEAWTGQILKGLKRLGV